MNDRILFLKACGDSIYGSDEKKRIILMDGENSKIIEDKIDWSHDFCFINGDLFYTKDRKIYDKRGNMKTELEYPIKIKFHENSIYVLDQEKSAIFVFDNDFKLIKTIGEFGYDKFEKQDELFFHFPVDFDVSDGRVGVIDTGNRRTVILKGDEKRIFKIVGKKMVFYDENTALILFGDIIYKIDLKDDNVYETEYEGIIDFCINPDTKELIVSRD